MERMKQLVHGLLSEPGKEVSYLQQLNEALLKDYELQYGRYLSIRPLQVEIFYVNPHATPPFMDINMQCISSVGSKVDPEIWRLQSNRFGRLYFHLRGRVGIDVCLSDSKEYALCATILSAVINGEEIWASSKVFERIVQLVGEHEHADGKEAVADLLNQSIQPVLVSREDPLTGEVYHVRRVLRRSDKNQTLPLQSFMDLWNEKLRFTHVQRIHIYMAAHPDADVLQVMRRHGFRLIPVEVRIRYGIPRSVRL